MYMFSKIETLKVVKEAIECSQQLLDAGYDKGGIKQRLQQSRLEYEYLLTLKDDENFMRKRYAFILAIESGTR